MQYEEYNGVNYKEIVDPTSRFRITSRDNYYVIDIELTALGFNGVEDTDWECVYYIAKHSLGTTKFRHGIRRGRWVVDNELNSSPGFNGIENFDWVNVLTIS